MRRVLPRCVTTSLRRVADDYSNEIIVRVPIIEWRAWRATDTWVRGYAIGLAAAVGVAIVCAVYSPGLMSSDSLYLYQQALSSSIDPDGKPPLTAFLWMWLVRLTPSPAILLLFQNVVFWTGLAGIAWAGPARTHHAVAAILGIGLFPTVLAHLGTLWIDVMTAVMLTLFIGMALVGQQQRSKAILAASLLPLWCGMTARLNALPAIIPLVVWFVVLWRNTEPAAASRNRVVAEAGGLALLLVIASNLFNRAVVDGPSGAASRSLQFALLHDLVGIADRTGDLRLPPYVLRAPPSISLEMIRSAYDPADVNLLVYNPQWTPSKFISRESTDFSELVKVWAGAIGAHPAAYLHRRADAFASIMQMRRVFYPFHDGIDSNALGLVLHRGPVYERLMAFLRTTSGVFFRGWAYGLVAFGIAVVAARRRQWGTLAVTSSGLCYVAPYLIVTTGADFRYIWWMIVATLIGAMMLLSGDARNAGRGPASLSRPPVPGPQAA